MYFEFMNKTKIYAGKNALSQLNYECQQYHMKHPLIITDDVLYQLNYVRILQKHLSIPYSLFTHVPVDSSTEVVEEIKTFYIQEKRHLDFIRVYRHL